MVSFSVYSLPPDDLVIIPKDEDFFESVDLQLIPVDVVRALFGPNSHPSSLLKLTWLLLLVWYPVMEGVDRDQYIIWVIHTGPLALPHTPLVGELLGR